MREVVKKSPRKNKREYLNDFVLNDNGEYEYKGIIYKINGELNIKYFVIRLLLVVSCVIICGIIPFSGSMHAFYIIMPYIVEVGVLALLVYAFLTFIIRRKELRDYIYKKTVERFKPYSSFLMGNFGLSLICVGVYSLINGFEVWAIGYCLLQIIGFVLIRQFLMKISEISYEKVDLKAKM